MKYMITTNQKKRIPIHLLFQEQAIYYTQTDSLLLYLYPKNIYIINKQFIKINTNLITFTTTPLKNHDA